MKIALTIIEDYVPQTDEFAIRLNALLLKHLSEDKYAPAQEFCIGWKKNYALEAQQVITMLRELADKIEKHGP